MRFSPLCSVALTTALLAGSNAMADTVFYSGFEGTGVGGGLGPFDASGSGYWAYSAGRTLNDNGVIWTVGGSGNNGGVDQIENAYAPVPFPPFNTTSRFALDMNSFNPGSITTSVTTVVGQEYSMSFWLSTNASGTMTGTISALPGGMTFTGTGAGWVQHFVNFIATSTSTTVSFASTSPLGTAGTALDEIRIQTVPLPAAAYAGLSALAGVAGLGAIRRRSLKN